MAWQVSKRVWDNIKTQNDTKKDIDASERLMLLALADIADESGICWPKHDTSYQKLGDLVGVNRRSAMRLVESLCEMGHLWKSETVGRGHSNFFIVVIGLSEAEAKERLALIGVTDDTIIDDKKVLPETPIIEPEKEMVLPVTQIGVMPDTNKGLNGVTHNTQPYLINPSIPSLLPKGNSGNEPLPSGNKDGAKNKSSPPPPSVQAYRSVANRFPDKATWEMINTKVGTDQEDLDFWKLVVRDYIACGFNKINIKTMLEYFERRELPKTKQGRKGNRQNGQRAARESEPGIIAAAQRASGDTGEQSPSFGSSSDTGAGSGPSYRGGGILAGH